MWMLYVAMLIIVIPIAFYLYKFIKRMFDTFGIKTDVRGVKYILYGITLCLSILCMNIFGIGAIIVLHIVVAGLVTQFVNFVIKKATGKKYIEGCKVWRWVYGSGLVPIAVTAVLVVYGYINMHNVVETSYTIYTDKEIREDGYKVALIADMHFGVSIGYEELLIKCQEISEKNPDIVVLCGDIIDDDTSKENMENVFKALGTIKSQYGIFYVYGNHDRQLYRTNKKYTETELETVIKENGIHILRDELYSINDDLVIAGREDNSYSRVGERLEISQLLKDVDKNDFILTLDHQPKEYAKNGEAGTDLLLSGHTHGGQIWPAQYIFALAKFDDAVYGYTRIDDDTQAIITSGFAAWGYPVKTAAPAEYVIIDIKHKD